MNNFGLKEIERKRTTRSFLAIGITLVLVTFFVLSLMFSTDSQGNMGKYFFGALPFLFLGLLLLVIGMYSLFKGKKEQKEETVRIENLKKIGEKIIAEIKSIDKEVIGWGRNKEVHEYYLCVGVSESNNVMLFKSNSINFYSRLKTIGESITVYYEPKDIENYYIEIE